MNARGRRVHVSSEPAREKLRQAIDSLRTDIDRVEFWADALDRLSQPIPEYPATTDFRSTCCHRSVGWWPALALTSSFETFRACVSHPRISAADCRMFQALPPR